MAIESTEMWSRRKSSSTTSQGGRITWQLRRGWMVTGATTVTDALTATPLDGRPIASINDPHPEREASTVKGYEDDWRGPTTVILDAVYDVPSAGTWSDDSSDPLQLAISISPDFVTSDRELEYDLDTTPRPVVNSSGIFFEAGTGPTTPVVDPGWVFARNEPTYPVAKVLALGGTTNDAPFNLPGIGLIDTGQGWIGKIGTDPFSIGAAYVRMSYAIYARADGWRSRTKDVSYQGFGSLSGGPPELGVYCNAYGEPFQTPVMLAGNGFPVYSDPVYVKLSNGIGEPVSNPTAIFPTDYLDQPNGDDGPTWIRFKRYKPASWTDLFG